MGYFGQTPFAHHAGPPGTTARLRKWFASLARCINACALSPASVANILRLLDSPGTPLYINEGVGYMASSEAIEKVPVTAAIFGSKTGLTRTLVEFGQNTKR